MSQEPEPDRPAALRAQILSTEHWSLLATRSATWHEIFSRTTIFLTVLSATVVALSLVVQAAGFGTSFRVFALVVLPIVLLVGVATFIRLVEADIEDAWLVIGMNRLRHGYLELAPDLERYFVTSHNDDELGVLQTYSFRHRVGVTHLLAGSPVIVGIIDALLSGVLAAIVCQALGGPTWLQVGVGVLVALGAGAMLGRMLFRRVGGLRRSYHPRFPSDGRATSRPDDIPGDRASRPGTIASVSFPAPTLYEYAGGHAALRRLADAQYRRCREDPVLVEIFGTEGRPGHVDHLADWLTEVLGGPKRYTDQHGGHQALLRHHANRGIQEHHRVRFVEAFMAAADEVGLPDHPVFRTRLHEYLDWGSTVAREVSQPGANTSSDDPVPVWDWGPAGPPKP